MAKQTNTIAAKISNAFKAHAEELTIAMQAHIDSRESMETIVTKMRKSKVVFGSKRTACAMLSYVWDLLGTLKSKGKPLAEGTKSNYLNAVKRSVNTGAAFTLNLSRDIKPKPAGQSATPKSKDKAKLTDDMADTDIMATDDPKPASVKPAAFKSNDQAIEALQAAVKSVKVACTAKQWQAIITLYPNIEKLSD